MGNREMQGPSAARFRPMYGTCWAHATQGREKKEGWPSQHTDRAWARQGRTITILERGRLIVALFCGPPPPTTKKRKENPKYGRHEAQQRPVPVSWSYRVLMSIVNCVVCHHRKPPWRQNGFLRRNGVGRTALQGLPSGLLLPSYVSMLVYDVRRRAQKKGGRLGISSFGTD